MRKRIDFSRENRPYCYYQRVAILHPVESVLFKIDSGYNFLLRAVNEKHNERAASCPIVETFLPGAVNTTTNEITVVDSSKWPVGRSVTFKTSVVGGLPAPLAVNTVYYILTSLSNKITLSLSLGGAVIPLTTTGSVGATFGLNAATCPDIGFQIGRVSSGQDEHYRPVAPQYFASPGPLGAGVYVETGSYPKQTGNLGVNFTATPRKLARPMDSLFIWGETIQVRITGQTINSPTDPLLNLPSYADILLVGRHYPESALPEWARGGR
jgi:hypothetical protein